MNQRKVNLAKYRIDSANQKLHSAKVLLDAGEFKDSISRSYYAIFTSVRAILALDGDDFPVLWNDKRGGTFVWLATSWAIFVVLPVFIFRNIGFNLILFMAGFQLIPGQYYDVTKVEGASSFQTFRFITLIYMIPTTFLVFMMSIINSFRIFREIYLLFGPYPHQSVYMLQHFMNNQFVAATMQRLSTTATLLALAIVILVWGIFSGQRKLSDAFVF